VARDCPTLAIVGSQERSSASSAKSVIIFSSFAFLRDLRASAVKTGYWLLLTFATVARHAQPWPNRFADPATSRRMCAEGWGIVVDTDRQPDITHIPVNCMLRPILGPARCRFSHHLSSESLCKSHALPA